MSRGGSSLHIQALLDTLRFDGAEHRSLKQASDADWAAFLDFCDRAQLALRMAESCAPVAPDWVKERLAANLADNTRRVGKLKYAYREVADTLASRGSQHLLLKGFAQTPDFVPRPELRMQSDFDIYCPEGHLFPARDALRTIGYEEQRTGRNYSADHLPAMTRTNGWRWRGNYYDPDMPPSVDLHFCFWNSSSTLLHIDAVNEFWGRRELLVLDDLVFATLSLLDSLCFSALHVLRDLLRGEWVLHRVYELAYFLHAHASDTVFWHHWERLYDTRTRELQYIAFALAQRWFACELPAHLEADSSPMQESVRSWLDHFNRSPLDLMVRANMDALWLHLSLLDSNRDRALVVRRHLLPERIPAIGAPGQDADRFHRIRNGSPKAPVLRFASYLVLRSVHQLRAVSSTMVRGLGWWLARNQLGQPFWAFFAASFCFDLGFSIYFFLYGLYAVGAGYHEGSLGVFATAMSLGGIAGSLPAGILLRRFPLERVLLLCFLTASAVAAARAVFLGPTIQLALAFLGGSALSVWAVSLSPAVAALVPEKSRAFAFSLVFSAGIGVGALGALLGGALPLLLLRAGTHVTLHAAERWTLLLSCVIVALGAIPVRRIRVHGTPTAHSTWHRPHPFLLRFLPCIAIWSLVTGAFGPFAAIYFSRNLHVPLGRLGGLFSFAQICQVSAILLAPLLLRRVGVLRGIRTTQFMTGAALLIFSRIHLAAAAGLVYVSYLGLQWMSEPGLYTLLMGSVPEDERSQAASLNFFVISLCQAGAATVAGMVITRAGYASLLCAMAVTAFLAALLFGRLLTHENARQAVAINFPKEQLATQYGDDSGLP